MTLFDFKKSSLSILNSPSPQLDLEVLVEHFTGLNKTKQLLSRDWEIPEEPLQKLQEAVKIRNTGLPIAYITGHKEFYGYDFIVSPAVLIPKPDTEILVERAVELIIETMESRPNQILTICDMCTGSGCIALAVLRTLTDVYKIPYGQLPSFTMVDISADALEIVKQNLNILAANYTDKIHLVRSNLFEQFTQTGGYSFDLILTNPPYIPHSMVDSLLKDGRREPRLALDGDVTLTGDKAYTIDGDLADDGLEIIRNLIPQAKAHLAPLGKILMETGEYNAEATALLAENHGFKTRIHTDLEGQLRVVEIS